jgi:hypothetical protein
VKMYKTPERRRASHSSDLNENSLRLKKKLEELIEAVAQTSDPADTKKREIPLTVADLVQAVEVAD